MALLVGLSLQIGAMAGPVSVTQTGGPTFDTAATQDKLTAKKAQIAQITAALEGEYRISAGRSLNQCFSGGSRGRLRKRAAGITQPDMFGFWELQAAVPGKKTVEKVAVKAIDSVLDAAQRKAGAVGCFAAGTTMDEAYKKVSGESDYDNKLMYFGSVDGVMAYYPGVLWARSQDYYGEKSCGADYDPRRRPWFLSGSTGPKNVIFILDSSGSMQQPMHYSRMKLLKTAAKAMMDGLTQADFVSVVDFDGEARVQGQQVHGASNEKFSRGMKNFIDGLSERKHKL